MGWTLTDDLDEYWAAAGGFLADRPVEHTIELTAIAALRSRGRSAFGDAAPLYGWWSQSGRVTAAMLHTPPYPVLLTALPDGDAPALARVLADRGRELPGVNAREPDAFAFADTWNALAGTVARVYRRSRLFRLTELVPPDPPPAGTARVAGTADLATVWEWSKAFALEVTDMANVGLALVRDRLSDGQLVLWEAAGVPVAMAGITAPDAGMIRIGPVYTPPEHRRRGYGGAVTVAASRLALERGAEQVVLFTDLANPTSNALYQRIGYRPVEDRVVLSFEKAAPSA